MTYPTVLRKGTRIQICGKGLKPNIRDIAVGVVYELTEDVALRQGVALAKVTSPVIPTKNTRWSHRTVDSLVDLRWDRVVAYTNKENSGLLRKEP